MNILIVEDDLPVATFIRRIIRNISTVHIAEIASSFETGFSRAVSDTFDIILIDISLGNEEFNGIDLCRSIRHGNPEIIVIMLTSSGAITSLEESFAAGANDYIMKPFRPKELILRIERWMQLAYKIENTATMDYEELSYNISKNEFYYRGRKLVLTKQQKRLLLLFLKQPEKLIPAEYIREKFWGDYPHSGKKRNLRSNIHLLRNSLSPCCDGWIRTIPGEGYVLEKSWK